MIEVSDRPESRDPSADPPGYPADLVDAIVTERGLHLVLRPIRPSDAPLLARFHEQLSSDSVFRRYFSAHPMLSDAELVHLTTVDYCDRLAFVLLDGADLVGVGRYDRLGETDRAEVAFLVDDDYQHQGLGILLLDHLVDAALPRGITTFVAETQAGNRDMMRVFNRSGFPVTSRLEDEVIYVRFPITPTEESRVVRAARAARWHAARAS